EERVTSMRLNNLSTSTTLESNKSLVREAYRRSSPWTDGRHASSAEGIVCLSNRCQRWRREHVSRQPGACPRGPRALEAGGGGQPRHLPDAPSRAWTPRPPGKTRREDDARYGRAGWRAPH